MLQSSSDSSLLVARATLDRTLQKELNSAHARVLLRQFHSKKLLSVELVFKWSRMKYIYMKYIIYS